MGVQETSTELWGGETRKAVANFPVSGERVPVAVVRWLGRIKGTAARVNAELGLLDDIAAEQATADKERTEWLTLLRSEGLLPARDQAPDEAAILDAMHRLLASTPARLKLISPYDVVGETRQPNLPGTVDEYPNWRLPLPVTLEELRADPRVAGVTAAFRAAAAQPSEDAHQ